jgi:hypothetical protein
MVVLPFFIAGALGESEAEKSSSVLAAVQSSSVLAAVRRAGIVFGGCGFGCSGRGARDCAGLSLFSIETTCYFGSSVLYFFSWTISMILASGSAHSLSRLRFHRLSRQALT